MPPPVHGMSNINASMCRVAKKSTLPPQIINTAPSKYSKHFNTKLWTILKLIKFAGAFAELLSTLLTTQNKVIYRPINGGVGQIYDIVFLWTSRLLKQKIFIHHHSFQYINKNSHIFKVLIRACGPEATHVVLGAHMAEKLSELYSIPVKKLMTISNSSFFEFTKYECEQQKNMHSEEKVVIGHLANLCTEKGLDIFLEICRELAARGVDFSARIAGPCTNVHSENIVLSLCELLPQVEYLGPLYGEAKNSFFDSLDIFIFPSKYKNEAEPLVLYEAACKGAFLIGSAAGCMENTIEKLNGHCMPISNEAEWVQAISDHIQNNKYKISNRQERTKRINDFNMLLLESKSNLNKFILELSNAAA